MPSPNREISRMPNSLRKPLPARTVRRSAMKDDRAGVASTVTAGQPLLRQATGHDGGSRDAPTPDQGTARARSAEHEALDGAHRDRSGARRRAVRTLSALRK